MTYIRAWMSSKFGQIRSGTTELAALQHLKNRCCPFSCFTVVVIPEKKSGERLQDHWSSGYFDCTPSSCGWEGALFGSCINLYILNIMLSLFLMIKAK